MSENRQQTGWKSAWRRGMRRFVRGFDLVVFVAALVAITLVVNSFLARSEFRSRIDLTKTRAYSLSPQTTALLSSLDDEWTIAVLSTGDSTNDAIQDQVDEVLRRFEQASPAISVVRVDPADPTTLDAYESLLAKLRDVEAEPLAAYDVALDEGTRVFSQLQTFAQEHAVRLQGILARLGESDEARSDVTQRFGMFKLLGDEGGKVLDAVRDARTVSPTRPIPDVETARSILAQGLKQWGDELYEMTSVHDGWKRRGDALAEYAASASTVYRQQAVALAAAADPLARLAPLELSRIGQQLERGEAAVIVGPNGTAVVPAEQIFPRMNIRAVGDGAVAFDRRFRGEQVIAAAIRSLQESRMPLAVFVHVEAASLLRQQPQNQDVAGVASTLIASRIEVEEWRVGTDDRPRPDAEQPVVWIVVPPSQRSGLEPGPEESALLRAAENLIADGESVLVNLHPSLLPRYRQPDPWAKLVKPLGVSADTGHVIFESVPVGEAGEGYQPTQVVDAFPGEHPVCAAVHGQPATFPLPLRVAVDPAASGYTHKIIASVLPDPKRWLDGDWAAKMSGRGRTGRSDPYETPVPIMMATEHTHPESGKGQRAIVVGSGGWMLSYIADIFIGGGGGPMALQSPGNQEMALASVLWLAGMDDLIAPSPVSRQVARLEGLDRSARWRWGVLAIVGLPLGCLVMGGLVAAGRRLVA